MHPAAANPGIRARALDEFGMTRTRKQEAEVTASVVVRCGEVRDLWQKHQLKQSRITVISPGWYVYRLSQSPVSSSEEMSSAVFKFWGLGRGVGRSIREDTFTSSEVASPS